MKGKEIRKSTLNIKNGLLVSGDRNEKKVLLPYAEGVLEGVYMTGGGNGRRLRVVIDIRDGSCIYSMGFSVGDELLEFIADALAKSKNLCSRSIVRIEPSRKMGEGLRLFVDGVRAVPIQNGRCEKRIRELCLKINEKIGITI